MFMRKKKAAPERGGVESRNVCLTLKAAALIGLVEAGVIRREETGDVDTDGFERFWCKFERNLEIAMDNAMAELSARYK